MPDAIQVDDLHFDLHRSPRRKTVGVTVERDGALTIRAPDGVSREKVEAVAREKQEWVYRKLAEKEQLAGPLPEKEFVTGESFYYLGRCYRLLVPKKGPPQDPPLKLLRGRLVLSRHASEEGWTHLKQWYAERGGRWITRKVERLAPLVGVDPVPVEVLDLGYRWGSCSLKGRLNFHWRSVILPPRIIEYLVVHELVHLRIPDHSKSFWREVERAMPDYASRREWLRVEGGGFG